MIHEKVPSPEGQQTIDQRALETVRILAAGIDPITGEQFPEESCYQHAAVVRALFASAEALEEKFRRQRRAQRLPTNTGSRWTVEESDALVRHFDEGKTVAELAKLHSRTEGGIEAKLVKLGKIEEKPNRHSMRFRQSN